MEIVSDGKMVLKKKRRTKKILALRLNFIKGLKSGEDKS